MHWRNRGACRGVPEQVEGVAASSGGVVSVICDRDRVAGIFLWKHSAVVCKVKRVEMAAAVAGSVGQRNQRMIVAVNASKVRDPESFEISVGISRSRVLKRN